MLAVLSDADKLASFVAVALLDTESFVLINRFSACTNDMGEICR